MNISALANNVLYASTLSMYNVKKLSNASMRQKKSN